VIQLELCGHPVVTRTESHDRIVPHGQRVQQVPDAGQHAAVADLKLPRQLIEVHVAEQAELGDQIAFVQ